MEKSKEKRRQATPGETQTRPPAASAKKFDRIRWHVEMRRGSDIRRHLDMTESRRTGSGEQSSVLCPDGLPVYREILCPHNTVIIL